MWTKSKYESSGTWKTGVSKNIGTDNAHSKLDDEKVLYARKMYFEYNFTLRELARELNVHHTTLMIAVKGITWKHV